MKLQLFILLTISSLTAFADHTDEMLNESGTTEVTGYTEVAVPADSLDLVTQNISKLYSGKNILFMKNPCDGFRGYNMQRTRGFGFENGIVKKFQKNGQISRESVKYSSLGEYLLTRKVCHSANKKLYPINFNIYLTQIW